MAKWNNNKFKTWLMEINATKLSQEKLKSKAVMFCEEFGEVDKKTISKIVEDFEKEHNRVVANVTNSIFEQMGGQEGKMRGRRDVPPTTYFPEDEDLLKMIQNDTIHQKKCVICNVILFSRDEVTNHESVRLGLVFRLGLVVDKTWFRILATELLSHQRLKSVHV